MISGWTATVRFISRRTSSCPRSSGCCRRRRGRPGGPCASTIGLPELPPTMSLRRDVVERRVRIELAARVEPAPAAGGTEPCRSCARTGATACVNGSTCCAFLVPAVHVAVAQAQRERRVGIRVRAEHREARLRDLLLRRRDRRLHFVFVDLANGARIGIDLSAPARSSDRSTRRRPRRRRPTAPCARPDRRAWSRAISLAASDSGDSLLISVRTIGSSGPSASRILSSENDSVTARSRG